MVQAGDHAPDFELPSGSGTVIRLRELRGKKVVIFFYPQDDTPTCTREACSFRDRREELVKRGAVVLGISPDSPRSHGRFAEKYRLPYPLLSDEKKAVMKAYGVWGRKVLFGRAYRGVIRTTVIVNEEGVVTHIFRNVRVKRHLEDVLNALSGHELKRVIDPGRIKED